MSHDAAFLATAVLLGNYDKHARPLMLTIHSGQNWTKNENLQEIGLKLPIFIYLWLWVNC
jgi:hypothetical protein